MAVLGRRVTRVVSGDRPSMRGPGVWDVLGARRGTRREGRLVPSSMGELGVTSAGEGEGRFSGFTPHGRDCWFHSSAWAFTKIASPAGSYQVLARPWDVSFRRPRVVREETVVYPLFQDSRAWGA